MVIRFIFSNYMKYLQLAVNKICYQQRLTALFIILIIFLSDSVFAGGPWVPKPGDGFISLGYSRKTANSIFDINGDVYYVPSTSPFQNHDFRYLYVNGEVGIFKRLSFNFLVTFLDGREGPDGHLEQNVGFSDSWFGFKYALFTGSFPMSLGLVVRSPMLYDIDGPYSRNLYSVGGELLGHSPEWRGLLKHDITLVYLVGSSLGGGKGWFSGEIGFGWREGAPADQIPIQLESGYKVPWLPMTAKGLWQMVFSLGNYSDRQPDDRFGYRPGVSIQNFNDASMGRIALSLIIPVGKTQFFNIEPGYARCIWGYSSRRYNEAFVSLWRNF